LLSLISGLAEHADTVKVVKDKDVAKAAKAISGKFKVVRLELPATKKSLRNIICGRLEDFMSGEELSFSFPADDQVDSNKDDLSNMMAQFNEKYPDHGLLLVVDELLDYLRSRDHQEVILDLGFLREMGEVCKLIRFRLIAGLQESLFDNPKFQFIAESLRRVKDRFEQARIVRQDVAFVVSERLLTKTEEQKAKIREHLQKFTPLYGGMAERLEEFVRLFPVHPTYLEVFEAISIAEKREVLKTLSAEIKRCFNNDVPPDQPGLISYDSYWEFLQANAVQRSVPEIREVIDVSKVVEAQIQNAFTRPTLKPLALRIIHGLSVKRLATDDIRAKIGPTAEELQNGLCLFTPIGVNEDGKKKELLKDARLESLKKLAGVSLLPHSSLTELQNRLAKLQPCFTLVKDDLDSSPICPHCNFRPQEENLGTSGMAVLQQIDQQLDALLENWSRTLLENLGDPTAKKSITLLPGEQKTAVGGFLKAKKLPEKISNDLVQGMQTALSGLIAISVKPVELLDALSDGGAPCTVEQLQTRFEEFLTKITRGKEPAKVRLVIDRGENPGVLP
jgi:hypothetical protein